MITEKMTHLRNSPYMKFLFKYLAFRASPLIILLLSAWSTQAAQLPCDLNWTWNTVENNNAIVPPAIADVGGILYAVTPTGGGPTLQSWDESSWTSRMSGVPEGTISILATSGDGYVYLAGTFHGLIDINNNLVPATNVARFNPADNTITPIGTGTPTPVYALAVDPFGTVFVGLDFNAPVVPSTGFPGMLVKFDATSQSWVAVGGGLHVDTTGIPCNGAPPPPDPTLPAVTALTVSGNDLYVAGDFDQCGLGSVTTYKLAKWSPCAPSGCWTALAPTRWAGYIGDSPSISSIAVNSNRLYVTGYFVPPCGATYPYGLAEFSAIRGGLISDARDNLWNALQWDGSYEVGSGNALCVRACTVYLTGYFQIIGGADPTAPNGVHANHIAHATASTRGATAWAAMGAGLTAYGDPNQANGGEHLAADEITDANHVFVSGSFTTAGPYNTLYIAEFGYFPQ